MLTIPSYTWGSDRPGAPSPSLGGSAYYLRRKRFVAYIMACLAILMVLP